MAKLAPTQGRIFKNIFVCKNCKGKMRSDPLKILQGKIRCRKCNEKDFRPIKKK